MNTIEDKIKRLLTTDGPRCFAVRGVRCIDTVHPITGRSVCYGKTLADIRAESPEYADAEEMTMDEYCRSKAASQRTPIEWDETTEGVYWKMLCCLPPAARRGDAFLVGEPWDHDALSGEPRYQCHRTTFARFEQSSRPITVAEFRVITSPGA